MKYSKKIGLSSIQKEEVGSKSIINGTRGPIVEEPLLIESLHSVKWQESRVNLIELALLRFTHGWSRKQLAEHYGRTEDAIQNYFQKIKKKETKRLF